MSDEVALLRAIQAEPDDDTPRLVYADWLDENGQHERAEFIRVQIEDARRTPDDEVGHFRKRAGELLGANAREWTKHFVPLDAGPSRCHFSALSPTDVWLSESASITFERGFPAEMMLFGPADNVCAVLNCLPTLRRLDIHGPCDFTPGLLDAIVRLRCLDVLCVKGVAEVAETAWAEFDHLPPWVIICCEDAEWRDDEARNAFQARQVARFEQLPPDEKRAGAVRSLRFWLRYCCPHAGRCVKIIEFGPELTDERLGVFASISEVEEVVIPGPRVTTAGLYHLARLPNLTRVEIHQCWLDSLAPLGACTGLTDLAIGSPDNGLTSDAGSVGLERLTNLHRLVLRGHTRDETVRRLAGLRHLRVLELGGHCRLEDETCLAVLANLVDLERLTIRAPFDTSTVRYVTALRNLRSLSLSGRGVTDEAVPYLCALENLRGLNVTQSAITEAGARSLVAALPAVTVVVRGRVVRATAPMVTLVRRSVAGVVSCLFPAAWTVEQEHGGACQMIRATEDGWDWVPVDPFGFGPGPLQLTLSLHDESGAPDDERRDADIQNAGADVCESLGDYSDRTFSCSLSHGERLAVLQGRAHEWQAEEFRPLFLFVARSLRVGANALVGIGEEITAPVSQL